MIQALYQALQINVSLGSVSEIQSIKEIEVHADSGFSSEPKRQHRGTDDISELLEYRLRLAQR